MADWNTELYLLFEDGRNKPIHDLVLNIPTNNPKRVVDIGCGPGNSTVPLKKLYANAEVIGIDSSPNMIETARKAYPEITWLQKNANEDLADLGKFDVVFSNSALHWLPNHTTLLPRLFDLIDERGVFAVQIPYFFGTPIYEPLYALVASEKWNQHIPAKHPTTYHDVGYYYDILSSCFTVFDIWTTKHTHILSSKDDIISWYKSTGFKAFLDQLIIENMQNELLSDISRIIDDLYKPQKDGKYLLRFERLFIVAQRT